MADSLRALPDALLGLAPTRATACPRCGSPTSALANGRGRLDICARCGTFEMTSPEGMTLFSLKGLELPRSVMKVETK
jgi:ribosomal protein S27AE